ncbi:MAG: urease accessory protein UreE [Caulobacterales bacterium]|nr:urease accessory protein UreE [Caulobacterales bacterium]
MTPGESAGPDAMLAARAVVAAGSWSPPPIDVVTLDYDARYRRRITLTCGSGRQVLLDLPRAQLLNHGDGLATEAGVIEVRAADEELAEVRCPDPARRLRIAWHLGNRHLPTEFIGETIRIRRDHVIEDMLVKLGAEVGTVRAPFNPEGGAYGEGRTHGHDHHHP